MKVLIRSLLLAGLLGCLLTFGAQSAHAVPAQKTVLVLSPFQFDLATNLITAQAMREEFGKATDLSLDVYYEFLDLNRFPDSAYQQEIFDLLTTKYKNKQVDLVIVSSEAMLKLWLAKRPGILPNTPIVFFDVFTEHLGALNLPANVTGVSGVEDCEKSLQWALAAMPTVNEVVLVGGVGKIEQGFFDHIQKLQDELKGQVKFTDLAGLPLAEIKQRVAKLPKTSIVLYHPMFEDADGNKYRPIAVLGELTAVSSVPVISGYDVFLATGIIGGYMYSIDQQARDAVQIGLRVLRGEATNSIPIEQNESDLFVFDHLALQRFNIPLSLLPPDSIVKNRQYSFWELYQPQIIATSTGVVILLLLIVFLLGITRQLNHTRLALANLNVDLETQVHERTARLNQTNTQLQDEITEHKRTEEKLLESEEKFRSLLDSQESNILMVDYDGVHHYVNQVGVISMTSSGTAQDIIGKRLHDLYPAHTADWQLEQIRWVITTGQGMSGDFQNPVDNQSSWWHLNLQPIRDAAGQVTQVMVNSLDITERKRAETALKDSELFVNGVLNSLTAQIAVLDERGVIVSVNEAWKKFAAANDCPDPACYVGANYLTVCETAVRTGDQSAEAMLMGMQAMLAGSQAQFTDEYPCDAPGIPRWFTVTVLPQNQPRKGLIVVHQDISERKLAEQALRRSESSFQAVLQSTADGILAVDSDNRVLFVNERFVEMWHIPAAVLASKDDAALIQHVLEQLTNPQEFLDKVQELYQSEQESFDSLNFKDRRVFERLSRPLVREQRASGRVWSFRDVTNRKRMEEKLRESERRTAIILRSSPIVIGVSTAAEGRYTDVNDAFENVLGYSPAETIGRTSFDLNLWVDDDTRPNILREIQAHGRVENLEIRLRRKSGEIFPALIFITPIVLHDTPCLLTMVMDITERKQAEEALRKSEEKWRSIFAILPVGVSVVSPEHIVTDTNPALSNILDLSEEDLLKSKFHSRKYLRADRTLMSAEEFPSNRAIKEQKTIRDVEIGTQKEDGNVIWTSVSATPLPYFSGSATVTVDITERKRTEEVLRETNAYLENLINYANAPIIVWDPQFRITRFNHAFEFLTGHSEAEVIGQSLEILFPPIQAAASMALIRKTLTGERWETIEIAIIHRDETVRTVLWNSATLFSADGQTPLATIAQGQDITVRKQAEEQLRDTRDTLQTIIHSSPLAILALDHEDHLTMWNPAAEAMFGWSDKHILGQANPTVPDNKSKEYEALRQATINGMAFSNLDTLRMKKDGTQFPVSLSVAPLRGQQNQVTGRMHIIADITDRKKLQEELRQQATTDELTKVSNRRHFIELAQSEIKRAIRLKRPPAIALIDIDHFKQVNDTFGHAAGDQALVAFSKICQKHIREIDVFARFGGDEFVLLMPETNQEQAYDVLERVRLALTAQPMDLDGKPVALTISSGIASLTNDQESFDMILSQADQALYRAKEAGRNNVIRFDKLRE